MKNKKEILVYILIISILIIVSILSFLSQSTYSNTPYSIENPSPNGTMAIANVLEERGTYVQKINSISELENIGYSDEKSAIIIVNPSNIPQNKLDEIEYITHNDIFFINMQATNIENINVIRNSQFTPIKSQCDTKEITTDTSISSSLFSLDTIDDNYYENKESSEFHKAKIIKCFPITTDNTTGYALIQKENDYRKITYIADGSLFTNSNITQNSNAAFTLNIFNKYQTVYWYISNTENFSSDKNTENKSITPLWTKNVVIIVLLSAIMLIFANIQRLGRTVKENLPVLIKNEETNAGKANLYRKNSDQNYTANILRTYYKRKLLKILNMNIKTPEEIFIKEISERTGIKYEDIEKIFYTQETRSNEELHILLLGLESIEKKVKNGKL